MQNIFTQVQFEMDIEMDSPFFHSVALFPHFFLSFGRLWKKGTFPQVEGNKRSGLDGEKYLLNVNNKNNRMWDEREYQSVSTYTTVSTNVSSMSIGIENARGKALITYTRSTLATLRSQNIFNTFCKFFLFFLFDTQNSPDYRWIWWHGVPILFPHAHPLRHWSIYWLYFVLRLYIDLLCARLPIYKQISQRAQHVVFFFFFVCKRRMWKYYQIKSNQVQNKQHSSSSFCAFACSFFRSLSSFAAILFVQSSRDLKSYREDMALLFHYVHK